MRVTARATGPGLAAGAHRVAQVLGFLIVQYFPLLIDSLPSLEDSIHRRALVDDEACGGGSRGRGRVKDRASEVF